MVRVGGFGTLTGQGPGFGKTGGSERHHEEVKKQGRGSNK